jgi:hypothetical protein
MYARRVVRLVIGMFRGRVVAVSAMVVLCVAGSAAASVMSLPSNGLQVNNDPPTIDPTQNVGLSDLSAGSLTVGNALVPWATFEQAQRNGSQQIVVRAFKDRAWHTEGFPVSLNTDPSQIAEAPSIDFTGASRTVPWVTWDEPSAGALGGVHQIFASRFSSQAPPAQNGGTWVHEGQGTVPGATPSLNINPSRDATKPSLVGGTTTAGANPAPWITWQEFDGQTGTSPNSGSPQIFVSHAVPAASGSCAGVKPARGNSVGKFCFQQVGIDRVQGPAVGQLDPSLNVDPTRSGIETDIAFTGPNDTVPWVVWYENSDSNGGHPSGLGLFNADVAFAARAVSDSNGDGGFHWQVVGLGTAGKTPTDNVLDNGQSSHGPYGECAQSTASEQACSLDANPATGLSAGSGAENPQVVAGTMVAGKPTTPWITWDESSVNGGPHAVFVARLDAKGDHFDLLNNGQPISNTGLDSTRPDIVFTGNTPSVSWHQSNGGVTKTLVGHFEGDAADPTFNLDTPAIATTPQGTSDVRSPLASTCAANPLTLDGAACPGGASATVFFAFTNSTTGRQRLFAGAVTASGCAVIVGCNATVEQQGASALITASLGFAAPVGIRVQRIVGRRLVLVGRVPFGPKHRGGLRIRWNLHVNGHKLRRGRYLITLRAFDAHKHVIAVAHSVKFRIH